MTNYLNLSIREINELLVNKTIKPIDLVNEAILKLENSDNVITLTKEEAIKNALELENKEVDNLLFGIPILIEDSIMTKDIKTTSASKMLEDFIPLFDATVISKLKSKNMIIIGKANMNEFGFGEGNKTIKSVKDKEIGLLIGNNVFGDSIYSIKPTYGKVSRYGLTQYASSMDQIGVVTNYLEDNKILLEAISGLDPNDAMTVEEIVTKKDIKVVNLNEAEIPYFDYIKSVYQTISYGEASSSMSRYDGINFGYQTNNYHDLDSMLKNTRGEGFGSEVKKGVILGTYLLSDGNIEKYYKKSLKIRKIINDNMFKDYDVIITKNSEEVMMLARLLGLPLLTMPDGTQFLGNMCSDFILYDIAKGDGYHA
jgi:aspartyl-tRNA(Asn)/glutamyl-tRNA(Gln) amidotransferase subunit A